jgi:predicted ATPase
MSADQLGSRFAFDGFIPSFHEMYAREKSYVDSVLAENFWHRESDWTLDVAQIAVDAGKFVDQTLASIYPLSPFRRPPSRWYIYSGSDVSNVGFDGELLPDLLFRTPSLVKETNRWLELLQTGYKLRIRRLGAKARDLYEIRLVDSLRRRQVEVGLLDVGFGISQMLPFIVQSLAASNQIITIEQPEIHVHPRLQADLGDLLVEAIQPPRCNQFVIETHSEHLILRLQRRVRERRLLASDISVVAVSRGPEGSVATALRLDDDGDFMDEFPGGFFPERLRELR